jgi:hypothetical protein
VEPGGTSGDALAALLERSAERYKDDESVRAAAEAVTRPEARDAIYGGALRDLLVGARSPPSSRSSSTGSPSAGTSASRTPTPPRAESAASVDVDGAEGEVFEGDVAERGLVGGGEAHRRRDAGLEGLAPAQRADAPAVAGACRPWKPYSRRGVERSLPTETG